jgi:hypothetical protein
MREFFPDHNQQEPLVTEMHKLTRMNSKKATLFILMGGIILGVFGFVLTTTERSTDAGTDLAGWLIVAVFLFIAGLSGFGVLVGIWRILHGAYSKYKKFENYSFYICTVVDKKIEVPTSSGTLRRKREIYAKKHGKGTFYNRQGLFHLFVMYRDMQGKEQRIFVEDYFYNQVKVGGEFIMAKSIGGKHLLPNNDILATRS